MPGSSLFYEWMQKQPGFAEKVARAREFRGLLRVERADDLADAVVEGRIEPNAGRIGILQEQWAAARETPRVYGDKVDITSAGRPLTVASDLDIAKALAHALAAPVLLAPTVIDAEAIEVKPEGEQ